jgi:dCMP deaminase
MTWERYFLDMLPAIASKSKDPSTQVGCVLAGPDNIILATGFNGFPRCHPEPLEMLADREMKLPRIIHAERNAIAAAARKGVALDGASCYIGWHPCGGCAGLLVQAGIRRVVIDGLSSSYNDAELQKRWAADTEIAKEIFGYARVLVHIEY